MATTPVRLDEDDVAHAREQGRVHGRSAAAQIAHWARLGRELERAPSTTVRHVDDVLSGRRPYDELEGDAQAAVRAAWADAVTERLADVDIAAERAASGASYAVLDDDGEVVVVEGDAANLADAPSERAVALLAAELRRLAG